MDIKFQGYNLRFHSVRLYQEPLQNLILIKMGKIVVQYNKFEVLKKLGPRIIEFFDRRKRRGVEQSDARYITHKRYFV